jgi:hypothetical protein
VGVVGGLHFHLRAGFQKCKSFVEMCTVRCCPLWYPPHRPMGTVPWVLVRRTVSPTHADFVRLISGAAPVFVRLDVVFFVHLSRPSLQVRLCRVVCWVDTLLDVISGVESALREGCPRTTTGVSQHWFSGHFRQVFFNMCDSVCQVLVCRVRYCGLRGGPSYFFISLVLGSLNILVWWEVPLGYIVWVDLCSGDRRRECILFSLAICCRRPNLHALHRH